MADQSNTAKVVQPLNGADANAEQLIEGGLQDMVADNGLRHDSAVLAAMIVRGVQI